jgi:hypothetical protein
MSHKSSMHVGRESDDRVLPTKCSNNDGKPSAEGAEGRRSAKENSGQATATQTQSWGNALSGLRRVREAAKKDKRLEDLHSRVHRGAFRAQPSKRAYIPKADGRRRPLGIAALETKSFSTPWERSSTRSTKRTFGGSPTDSGQGEANMTHWMRYGLGS